MFIVHDPAGRILQTTFGPEPESYGKILTGLGHQWVFLPGQEADIVNDFYDLAACKVCKRPAMPLVVTGSVVSGVPADCLVEVWHDGVKLVSETVSDGEVGLDAEMSGNYRLTFVRFPFLDAALDITL